MAKITPEIEEKLIKGKAEADKHFSNHPEIDVTKLVRDSAQSIHFCKTVVANNPQYVLMLFSLFQKEIKAKVKETGLRYMYFIFESSKRLQEWVLSGDCSQPISIEFISEDKVKGLSNMYPKSIEASKNNKETIFIVLGSSMHNLVSIYSAIVLEKDKFNDSSTSDMKQEYPLHSKLEALISVVSDTK